jgi:hypothetical protein
MTRLPADSVPAYEYVFSVAAEDLDREAVLVIQDNGIDDKAQLSSIKWRHLLTAVHTRAEELVHTTGLSPRNPGDASLVVGLLAHTGYQFLVTQLALLMLRWTVRQLILRP